MFGNSKIGTPFKGYYITAYGIAVKHGFVGSEEEWLASLNGGNAEFRYNSETKMIEYRHSKTEVWTEMMTLAEFQEGVIKDTLTEMNGLRNEAAKASESAQGSAKQASEAAESAINDKGTVATLKNEAEQAADAAREYAENARQTAESIKEAELTDEVDLTACTVLTNAEFTQANVISATGTDTIASVEIDISGNVEFSCEMDTDDAYCCIGVNGGAELDAALPGFPFTFSGEVTSPISISFAKGNLTFHYFRSESSRGSTPGIMPKDSLRLLYDLNEKTGDIDTALDELHTYAQALAGGVAE